MSRGILVGLTGYARCGKDTFAGVLVREAVFERRAFADPLKAEVAEFLGITVDELERRKAELRPALQLRGTEYWRARDPEHWIKLARAGIDPGARTVITDVRFPNEAELVRELGGTVVRIKRTGEPIGADRRHASESGVDLIEADHTFTLPYLVSVKVGVEIIESVARAFLIELGVDVAGHCQRGGCP